MGQPIYCGAIFKSKKEKKVGISLFDTLDMKKMQLDVNCSGKIIESDNLSRLIVHNLMGQLEGDKE